MCVTVFIIGESHKKRVFNFPNFNSYGKKVPYISLQKQHVFRTKKTLFWSPAVEPFYGIYLDMLFETFVSFLVCIVHTIRPFSALIINSVTSF